MTKYLTLEDCGLIVEAEETTTGIHVRVWPFEYTPEPLSEDFIEFDSVRAEYKEVA